MPSVQSAIKSRWDAWPPTQVRLRPTTPKEYPSLDDIDEDPLTYFLTPAPELEGSDPTGVDGDMDMDFDAGIETPGSNNGRDIIRSISPSSLEGLDKGKAIRTPPPKRPRGFVFPPPPAHPPSSSPVSTGPGSRRIASPPLPELSDLAATPDTDEDEEDYIRFAPRGTDPGMSMSHPLWSSPLRGKTGRSSPNNSNNNKYSSPATSPPSSGRLTAESFLTPSSSFPVGSVPRGRGRTSSSSTGRGRKPGHWAFQSQHNSNSRRARPNHLWREPSPDVWSIEEETEDELMLSESEMGSEYGFGSRLDREGPEVVDEQAAKPIGKKVRFILPAELI